MLRRNLQWAVLLAALCAGCGARPAAEAVPPSPTIAAMAQQPTAAPPAPAPSRAASPQAATAPPLPLATGTPAPGATAEAAPESDDVPFAYLWPEHIPAGMTPAPAESRIARDGELGPGDIGFFVVTFNGGDRKLVVGGGAAEPFPITGRISTLALGERGARLVTSEGQRQLVISGTQGALFVYGVGIAEDELVQVAESLRPIDVAELRRRVAGAP